MPEIPAAPLTVEGSYVLHQIFRLKRAAWRAVQELQREHIVREAAALLTTMERGAEDGHPNQSALYSLIGNKGDLLVLHFRETLEDLHRAELAFFRLELADYLEPAYSYLSVVELGLYESSAKTYAQLSERRLEPHSTEWNAGITDVLARQKTAMAARLFPAIPSSKYICFYPMDRKRGEDKNWYQAPMAERQRMMHEHGLIGRRYADCVRQIITGSIGFDDWEWGVDLFADDPLVFKKLIYEMRFDEVSAVYAAFGQFYVGLRIPGADISKLVTGEVI